MRFDKLTLKAQEALQEAQALAEKHEHQQVEPEPPRIDEIGLKAIRITTMAS